MAASMMDSPPRNSLVLAHLFPSQVPWVGEIMNIITVEQSFGQEAFVQIRWLKPLGSYVHAPDSI